MGKRTAERAFRYGANIKHVIPVGSMFMEYYWFNKKKKQGAFDKQYDIVYLGVNFYMTNHIEAYSSFVSDYYEAYRWLVDFSKRNLHLKIGIKHHFGYKGHKREKEIIKNSPIEIIDQTLNSYELAFNSKCPATFCSTMGYELIAHGKPTLFLDPGRRNIEILPEDGLIDDWRVTTYEDFSRKAKILLSGGAIVSTKTKPGDLCLDSRDVSERIYSHLLRKGAKKQWLMEGTVYSQ